MKAYREWNKRDAARWAAYQGEEITRDQWVKQGKDDPMPSTPTDDEFKIVDGRPTSKTLTLEDA